MERVQVDDGEVVRDDEQDARDDGPEVGSGDRSDQVSRG